MAAGQRYKWQGSRIEFAVDFSANSPGGTITAITKASPAHVTGTNSLDDGDVVKITGVVGMLEVNEGVFVVTNTSGAGFDLTGVDSTGYGTYTSGGTFDEALFSNWCELTNYNRQGGSSPEIDATTICSTAAEFEVGLPDFGTTALDYNFAPFTDVQQALEEFHTSGEVSAVRVILPRSGGTRVQLAFVQTTSEQSGNGALWKGSATLRNTGQPVDIAA